MPCEYYFSSCRALVFHDVREGHGLVLGESLVDPAGFSERLLSPLLRRVVGPRVVRGFKLELSGESACFRPKRDPVLRAERSGGDLCIRVNSRVPERVQIVHFQVQFKGEVVPAAVVPVGVVQRLAYIPRVVYDEP